MAINIPSILRPCAVMGSNCVRFQETLSTIRIKTGKQEHLFLFLWALGVNSLFQLFIFCRYTYCQKCFSEIPGDTVNLGDDPTAAQA